MIEGFRFTLGASENNQFLPMNRRMFCLHSMVECLPSSSYLSAAAAATASASPSTTSLQEDRHILELLLRQNEVKDHLVRIMQKLYLVRDSFLLLLLHARFLQACE